MSFLYINTYMYNIYICIIVILFIVYMYHHQAFFSKMTLTFFVWNNGLDWLDLFLTFFFKGERSIVSH